MVIAQATSVVAQAEAAGRRIKHIALEDYNFEEWGTIAFRLEGTQPLLMHNAVGNLTRPVDDGGATKKKVRPTPEEDALKSRYTRGGKPDGNLVITAIMVRACLMGAAARFTVPQKRYSMKVPLSGALQIDPDATEFDLIDGNGKLLAADEYEVDVRRVVVNRAGIERGRAKIPAPWSLDCQFTFDQTLVGPQDLQKIIHTAGRMQGLADYRPSSGGPFGTFRLASLSLLG